MHTTSEVFTAVCAKIKCGVSNCDKCTSYFGVDTCPTENITYEEMDELLSSIYDRLNNMEFTEKDIVAILKEEPQF